MSGRLLYAFRVVPVALWRHLSEELGIATPDVASLRTLYGRSEEHTSELQSPDHLVCRLLLEKKKKNRHSQSTYSHLIGSPGTLSPLDVSTPHESRIFL